MLIGAHVGSKDPLAEAAERNADLVQIFISNPQSYKKPVPRDDAAELIASGLPIYVHAPYLMNPVSPNNRIRIPSRKTLAQTVEAADAIGARGVIVHGGHVGDDEDIAVGYRAVAQGARHIRISGPDSHREHRRRWPCRGAGTRQLRPAVGGDRQLQRRRVSRHLSRLGGWR